MPPRTSVTLVPLTAANAFQARLEEAENDGQTTLGQLLDEMPALSLKPLYTLVATPVANLAVEVVPADPDRPLHWPPGMKIAGVTPAAVRAEEQVRPSPPATTGGGVRPGADHPESLDEHDAIRIAHDQEIAKAAEYLDAGLSVLVRCEKLLVEHLAAEIAARSGRTPSVIPGHTSGEPRTTARRGMEAAGSGRRQQILGELQEAVRYAGKRDVIVVAHLDLLAGGSDAALTAEARELIDVLYERSKVVLLAFVDPSLAIPEVLANRFSVRIDIDILPRDVSADTGKRVPIGTALVTREEAGAFTGFDSVQLYKHIAGMNAVRLRHAMIFARRVHPSGATFAKLIAELRIFKTATTSGSFEVPNVSFADIGGYPEVRAELHRALKLIRGAEGIPEELQRELMPRGFIFHGPPGTGKTLFAKAVATAMDATILVVSGPEVTDMYVGESERKVREIFAEARRNAPAIIVFDEFDSIASRRSGREDGGSRAGNAIVAQLLTEMDGFRAEVPVLIIGTTNRLDIIDDALLRPSRFQPIRIGLPDEAARREIARVHARRFGVPVGPALLDRIMVATKGMNGDEIQSLFRDARANQLLSDPDGEVTPRQLGALVGQLGRTAQERALGQRQSGGPAGAPGRPGPAGQSAEPLDDVVLTDPSGDGQAGNLLEARTA